MPTSQNGYPANDISLTESRLIPGTSRKLRVCKGAPGYLLAHFAAWFDKHIESIDNDGELDDWGYAERPIRGSSTTLSNHASGTAIDLNAPEHPLGVRNTFTNSQEAAIRRQLQVYEGAIRWGGDYRNRADEMHFEIDKSYSVCARVADKLLHTAPVEGVNLTISLTAIRMAADGKTVTHTYKADAVQVLAWGRAVGAVPRITERAWNLVPRGFIYRYAIRCIQAKFGLVQDGIFGPVTASKMKPYGYVIVG